MVRNGLRRTLSCMAVLLVLCGCGAGGQARETIETDKSHVADMGKFLSEGEDELYTADGSKLYTADGSKLYTADGSKLYTEDGSKLYTEDMSKLYVEDEEELYADDTSELYTDDTSELYTDDTSELYTDNMGELYTDNTEGFYIKEIDDMVFARMKGKSYKEDCPIPIEDLRYIHVLHKDLAGEMHEGELIVNVAIAQDVMEIFRELYEISYPIERIRLVDEYDADDELSMEDNNSSSFNYRNVSASTTLSKHALGMAIDINPLYNPYIKNTKNGLSIEPITAEAYANRESEFDYKITATDDAYRIFTEHGFEWGGNWKNSKDYQHFEVPTAKIRSIYAWY